MTAPAVLLVQVFDSFPQELAIDVSGPDVMLFACNRRKGDPAAEDAIPDPVELFVGALNQQMFPRPGEAGCVSSARILSSNADLSHSAQSWRLRIEDAHPACLRVLVNLLAARDLGAVEVRGSASAPQARRLDPTSLPYPPARPKLPFVVEREESIRAFRDRFIQIEFAHPPTDQSVDSVSAVLGLWCDLMLLGGFPPEDRDPRESGVLPDGPIVLDETTVQMAFPDAFQADDAAFNCMLNHLYCLSQHGERVALVRIR
jgi:hypothetical protein